MLEAADYEDVDLVSPCFGKVVDTLCANSETRPVREVLCSYSDLIHNIRKRVSSPRWTHDEPLLLNHHVNRLCNVSVNICSPHQASNMGTSK